MTSEEMIQVLHNYGAFAYGQEEDIENIAEEWEDYDFSPAEADDWLGAGCFRAADAREMVNYGIAPEDAERHHDQENYPGVSIGYAVANGDLTISEAKKIIEKLD
jgi:hypothetical protein